ncbi:MAG: hypothetical protein WC589_13675 [Sphingobacterium sp.]|uniref:hypothetical protein n=1 Tax=Sphingobacterium TaxID=28453 RepID=UPI00129CBD9C|nr:MULTISPECIES: hypothetical protein [Sphingobacterium]MBB1643732.1 hypothetical protein [Sphingobacterium sp. UME9]WET68101.1 MAG: hypothetical protein P0Y57_19870 [Sphingobacterium sp.]
MHTVVTRKMMLPLTKRTIVVQNLNLPKKRLSVNITNHVKIAIVNARIVVHFWQFPTPLNKVMNFAV